MFREESDLDLVLNGRAPSRAALSEMEANSAALLDLLARRGARFDPSFATSARQMERWGLAAPIPDLRACVRYKELSLNAHGDPSRTDIARRLGTRDLFEEYTPVLGEALNEYVRAYGRVADACAVLTINSIRPRLESSRDMMRGLLELRGKDDFRRAQLEFTGRLIKNLVR